MSRQVTLLHHPRKGGGRVELSRDALDCTKKGSSTPITEHPSCSLVRKQYSQLIEFRTAGFFPVYRKEIGACFAVYSPIYSSPASCSITLTGGEKTQIGIYVEHLRACWIIWGVVMRKQYSTEAPPLSMRSLSSRSFTIYAPCPVVSGFPSEFPVRHFLRKIWGYPITTKD